MLSRCAGGTPPVSSGENGVASYDVALSNQQIADLYTAYTVPEPSALMLVSLGGLAFLVRRRK